MNETRELPKDPETPEYHNEISGEILKYLITEHEVVNEGRDGYIVRVDKGSIPEEKIEALKNSGIIFPEDANLKILKLFTRGRCLREFEITREASQVLRRKDGKTGAPKVSSFGTVTIDEELRKKMPHIGTAKSDAEVLVMEYVPGRDLATQLYYELAQLIESDELNKLARTMGVKVSDIMDTERQYIAHPEDLLGMGISELERFVAGKLGFIKPAGGDSDQEVYRLQKAMSENIDKIHRFLRKKGLVFDDRVFDYVEKMIDKLHAVNIYHNDLHERNVVVNGNILIPESDELKEGEGPDVYIIDFGLSSSNSHPITDIVRDDDIMFADDYGVVNRWRTKGRVKYERSQTAIEREDSRYEKLLLELRRIQSDPVWREERKDVWNHLSEERQDLKRMPYFQESVRREKLLDVYSRILFEINESDSEVPLNDRLLDILTTLVLTYPEANKLLEVSDIGPEKRRTINSYIAKRKSLLAK